MVACSERQRVRGLLAEAINMLCRSSLKYKFGFSIEGLLGITIDNSQVLLINIQEEFKDKTWGEANVGKPPSSPTSNSPIDLRTTSSSSHQGASREDQVKVPLVAEDPWYCPPEDRLSPVDYDGSDLKPETMQGDLCMTGRRNGSRPAMLSNGESGMNQRRVRSVNTRAVKREPRPFVKQCQRYPGTPVHAATAVGNNFMDLTPDIIYVKDEEDSDCSLEASPDPRPPPPSQSARPKRKSIAAPQCPQERVPSPEVEASVSPVVIKMEDDDSSRGTLETGGRSPAWREQSPSQVTYEAGTWAENIAKAQKRRARKAAQQTDTSDSVCDQLGPVSLKKTKKGRTTALIDQSSTSDQPELVSASDKALALDQISVIDQPSTVDQSDVGAAALEEVESPPQANLQLDGDQTEWPADLPRRPRASYSTAYKLMVVRKAIESGNMRATARKFGIHFKQVWQWTRNKEKLLAMSLSALRSPRLWPQSDDTDNPPGGATRTATSVPVTSEANSET